MKAVEAQNPWTTYSDSRVLSGIDEFCVRNEEPSRTGVGNECSQTNS